MLFAIPGKLSTVLSALAFLALIPLVAQEPPPPPPGGGHPMHQPKNLKLLKPEELMPTMMFFKKSLGVQCEFCHMRGDFASDENPHKNVARGMIVMARDINAKFFDNANRVTCFTCHRGATEPLSAPNTTHMDTEPQPHPPTDPVR